LVDNVKLSKHKRIRSVSKPQVQKLNITRRCTEAWSAMKQSSCEAFR